MGFFHPINSHREISMGSLLGIYHSINSCREIGMGSLMGIYHPIKVSVDARHLFQHLLHEQFLIMLGMHSLCGLHPCLRTVVCEDVSRAPGVLGCVSLGPTSLGPVGMDVPGGSVGMPAGG
jgi:hypothetical protein